MNFPEELNRAIASIDEGYSGFPDLEKWREVFFREVEDAQDETIFLMQLWQTRMITSFLLREIGQDEDVIFMVRPYRDRQDYQGNGHSLDANGKNGICLHVKPKEGVLLKEGMFQSYLRFINGNSDQNIQIAIEQASQQAFPRDELEINLDELAQRLEIFQLTLEQFIEDMPPNEDERQDDIVYVGGIACTIVGIDWFKESNA